MINDDHIVTIIVIYARRLGETTDRINMSSRINKSEM